MGKVGRVACISLPLVLTIVAFICALLVNIGGFSKSSPTLNSLYFFSADFGNETSSSTNTSDLSIVLGDVPNDIYQIHLWNYCSGPSSTNGTHSIDYCSARTTDFYFDLLTVWGVDAVENSTSLYARSLSSELTSEESTILGSATTDALKVYKKVSTWMFAAYVASLCLEAATIVLAVFAVCSRLGSLVCWIMSVLATIMLVAASITSTVLFRILVDVLQKEFSGHSITISLGTRMLAVSWVGAVASLVATLFWLFSACCCSGKSNPHHYRDRRAGQRMDHGADFKGPYETIQHGRGGSDASGLPLNPYQGPAPGARRAVSYEPYRQTVA